MKMNTRANIGLALLGAILLALLAASCAPPPYRGMPEDQLWKTL